MKAGIAIGQNGPHRQQAWASHLDGPVFDGPPGSRKVCVSAYRAVRTTLLIAQPGRLNARGHTWFPAPDGRKPSCTAADWTVGGKVAGCDKKRKKQEPRSPRAPRGEPAVAPFDEDVQASRVMTAGLWKSSRPLPPSPIGASQQLMTSAGCLAICPIAILSRLDEAQLRFPLIHT